MSTTKCDNDATTTKRWAPLSPPDGFNVADIALLVSEVLATRGARGELRENCVPNSWWS
jgi:hypothetical protein